MLDDLEVTAPPATVGTVPLPDMELTVASDGCGVIRTELDDEPHGLQWVVRDRDGFQVLARNALGETRYRYFQPGTYTVELKAWDGEKYAPISNTVTIDCRARPARFSTAPCGGRRRGRR